jgi:hypothetical protein
LRHVGTIRSVELLSDVEPIAALARFVEIATSVLAERGFEVEGKGRDWAHWTRGVRSVIRVYAFRDGSDGGVSCYRQGDVSHEVLEQLAERVSDLTGWSRREAA